MRKYTTYKILFALADFGTAFLSWIVFYFIRKQILGENTEEISLWSIGIASLISFLWLMLYFLAGVYSGDPFRKSRLKESIRLFQLSFFGCILIFFALLLDDEGINEYTSYYKTFLSYFVIQFLLVFFAKIYLISIFQMSILHDKNFKFPTSNG